MLLHDRGKMIVTDIYKKFGLPQSQASQQLAILRRAGYVIAERDGNNIYYSVNYKRIKEVQQLLGKLIQ
jgi:DNA-binding transcriptional ArsR family regulator